MRDLRRYPITLDEARDAVVRAAREHEERLGALPPGEVPIGDIHGAALKNAADRLHRLGFAAWDGKSSRKKGTPS